MLFSIIKIFIVGISHETFGFNFSYNLFNNCLNPIQANIPNIKGNILAKGFTFQTSMLIAAAQKQNIAAKPNPANSDKIRFLSNMIFNLKFEGMTGLEPMTTSLY